MWSLIALAFARLFGFLGVLGFTYGMFINTGNPAVLWLLGLIFTLGVIPTFGLEKGVSIVELPDPEPDNDEPKPTDNTESDDLFN